VANMSLGSGPSDAVDQAVKNSASKGIFYALAAGNDHQDACNHSPARAGAGTNNGILTVGATDKKDKRASFSNKGSCVDIWAPGVNIPSTRMGGGTTTKSGTSMASPHGAGGSALYLSKNTGAAPPTVEAALESAGQKVRLNPPKRLLVRTF
jgi:aqualysin 1